MLFQANYRQHMKRISANEGLIDEIKPAMKGYLTLLTQNYLSRRQSILIQHVNRCVVEIERIGDHIEALAVLSVKRRKVKDAIFGEESFKRLFELYTSAAEVLRLVTRSLDPNLANPQAHGEAILLARDAYRDLSIGAKDKFAEKMDDKSETPMAGIYYSEYVSGFDRIVRHAKTIALAERHPTFWIKRKKLDRKADAKKVPVTHELIDPADFLDRLRWENEL
jgi:phosphate:Na+ symporter